MSEQPQDWEKVTYLRKNKPTAKEARSATAINRAMATGNVEISRKYNAGANKPAGPGINVTKVAEETEASKVATVNPAVSKAIIRARQEQSLTQKELAVKINEKVQVVNEYESAKALPHQAILGKLERALGVKLRGSDIGSKLEPRGSGTTKN